ncbi:MAG TPA: AAA family ATPase [Pedobacter sp.]|jgi:predicted ATPase
MNKFIITGGPGSGKTSLIEQLELRGYACSKEASRQLIIEQVALVSEALPWLNLSAFADLALERMKVLYCESQNSSLTFFDRGIPDIIGYLKFAGRAVAEKYYEALDDCSYNSTAFILPPWEEIYVNDSERWQSFEESVQIYEAIKETYGELNFNLIEVPKVPIKDRVTFILNEIN